jgi:hypothetical protein
MKYTILEILPGQIRVEFEDNSWAIVPVKPNATLDEIDDAVSKYDPDFILKPESIINPDISIGDQRESKKVDNIQPVENQSTPQSNTQDNSLLLNIISPINLALSEYFHRHGDSRLRDLLDTKISEYISSSQISADLLITNISNMSEMYTPEDIMAQAEAELNAEQS